MLFIYDSTRPGSVEYVSIAIVVIHESHLMCLMRNVLGLRFCLHTSEMETKLPTEYATDAGNGHSHQRSASGCVYQVVLPKRKSRLSYTGRPCVDQGIVSKALAIRPGEILLRTTGAVLPGTHLATLEHGLQKYATAPVRTKFR